MQFNTKEDRKADYIGDGVYVDFDGYSIWLKANKYDLLMTIKEFEQKIK